ncbi:MAG: TRAP transporter substrate-binding protein [Negativicutes bacterium]|nr:TRAP transporter substrate-binding protein [Negativicutes bacterium]
MTKRKWIVVMMVAVFSLAALLSGCGQKADAPKAAEGPKYKLKLATGLPEGYPVADAMIQYAKNIKEKSKGEVEITVFNNGTLGQERDIIEGLKMGTIDMADVNASMMSAFAPRWQVFALPYVFESEEHMLKAVNGPIGQSLMKDLEKSGLKGMALQWTGFRSITTKKGPINTPDDLKGLKIRVMPAKTFVDTINMMGAIATPMDQGAVYNALQSGVLDGWENSPATVIAFKMHEVCPYYSYTKQFVAPNMVIASLKSFEKLPPEIQKLLMDEAVASQKYESDLFQKAQADAVQKLTAQGMKFNEVDTQPFMERTKPIWKTLEGEIGKDILDGIDALRAKK